MKRLTIIILSLLSALGAYASDFVILSPDGRLKAVVSIENEKLSYTLIHDSDTLIAPSRIGMDFDRISSSMKLRKQTAISINESIPTVAYTKATVLDKCNELTLTFKHFGVVFRAYDQGFAWRFVSHICRPFKVMGETAEFNFPEDNAIWLSYVENKRVANEDMRTSRQKQLSTSHENVYSHIASSTVDPMHLAFLPTAVDMSHGKKICITETALYDYPGMYMRNPDGRCGLVGEFAEYPKSLELGGHNMLQLLVKEREEYIARYESDTQFPWRIIAVAENDANLLCNDLPYILAPKQDPSIDFNFVKPGKVAWDWWNNWNLYGVDFEAGINNDTYKYYIDFASAQGIEYVILDEGWSTKYKGDLLDVIPQIDLPMLVEYANQRNVGIILWAGYYAFEKDMEKVCEHYSRMGLKGFKVDFMDRDDQIMTDFHRRAAEMTARYDLMIDFHGTYKPVGLHRTYPNVVNYEGVHGLEQMKWRSPETDQVTYDVTIPFVRMMAGPMDYTQGAMRNASRANYHPCNTEPMSQGTRCRQLAEYVVFYAPLTMMCDSPSNYMAEPQCTALIASIPTVWDETVPLSGRIGEHVAVARRNGSTWWIGAMTNWDSRTLTIDLSFLPEGEYTVTQFTDGPNANKAARDYAVKTFTIRSGESLTIPMAPGGGYIASINLN